METYVRNTPAVKSDKQTESILYMNRLKYWIGICMMLLLASCKSPKDVVYLQDVVPLKQQEIEQK